MTVTLPASALAAAAIRLAYAGAWDAAYDLVSAADCVDPVERARLALARTEIAVADDEIRGGGRAPMVVESAGPILAVADDAALGWEFALLRVRHDRLAPTGSADALAERADRLVGTAPAGVRIGLAGVVRGLIADDLAGDPVTARAWYERALADGAGDPLSDGAALGRLAGHDRAAGDPAGARRRAERAAERYASVGFVPGVLAQQLQLAELAAEAGDAPTAAALAGQVARWAGAIGAERHRRTALAILDRQPTP